MKTLKSLFEKTPLRNFFLLILTMSIIGCGKDEATPTPAPVQQQNPEPEPEPEPEPVLSSDKQITSFVFLLTNNPIDINVVATIDEENKTITAAMPPDTDLSGLLPEVQLSELATVDLTTAQNFTAPLEYKVTAEDGSTGVYTVIITALLTQRQILQAILDANPGNTLPWNLNNTANLDALAGVITNTEGQIIRLSVNGNGLSSLPPEIGQLGSLEILNWFGSNLSSVPPEIGQLGSLEVLELGSNKLVSLPAEIGQLGSLAYLDLSNNELVSLTAEIKQLVNLETLDLRNNNLSEFNHVAFIPSGGFGGINPVAGCSTETNLEILLLSGNPDLKDLNQCICDLDLDKGGTVDIDVVPDGVKCVGNNVIGN